MKFLIVDKNKRLGDPGKEHYAVERIQQELDKMAIPHDFCHFSDISVEIIDGKLELYANKKPLSEYTHIIPRGHHTNEYYIKQMLVAYSKHHEIKVQNAEFIQLMPDYSKVQQMIAMGEAGIPYIPSYFTPAGNYHEHMSEIEKIGFPMIYKHIYGEYKIEKIDGVDKFKKNIYLLKNQEELKSQCVNRSDPDKYFVQRFVDIGEDFRAFMIGGKFLCGSKRKATENFITVNKGEYTALDNPTPEFLQLCEKTAKVFAADYCAIDIIYVGNTPYVLEINMAPGFKSFETKIKGISANIPRAMIENLIS